MSDPLCSKDTAAHKTLFPMPSVTGVILAGGQGRRMGGEDKGWVVFRGQPLIHHVMQCLSAQVDHLVINANRSIARYQGLGVSVLTDLDTGFQGPLMGMATGLYHAQTDWVLCVPCDTPDLPSDLAVRLWQAAQSAQAPIAAAHDGERLQPAVVLLQRDLLPSLQRFLAEGGRKVERWLSLSHYVTVSFPASHFINLNSPEDLERLGA